MIYNLPVVNCTTQRDKNTFNFLVSILRIFFKILSFHHVSKIALELSLWLFLLDRTPDLPVDPCIIELLDIVLVTAKKNTLLNFWYTHLFMVIQNIDGYQTSGEIDTFCYVRSYIVSESLIILKHSKGEGELTDQRGRLCIFFSLIRSCFIPFTNPFTFEFACCIVYCYCWMWVRFSLSQVFVFPLEWAWFLQISVYLVNHFIKSHLQT